MTDKLNPKQREAVKQMLLAVKRFIASAPNSQDEQRKLDEVITRGENMTAAIDGED